MDLNIVDVVTILMAIAAVIFLVLGTRELLRK